MTKILSLVLNKSKGGKLKLIKESKDYDSQDYGCYKEGTIFINLNKTSKENQEENKFISAFSTTILHEFIHMLVEEQDFGDDFILGEEKAIRKICGEPWDAKLENLYTQDAKTEV